MELCRRHAEHCDNIWRGHSEVVGDAMRKVVGDEVVADSISRDETIKWPKDPESLELYKQDAEDRDAILRGKKEVVCDAMRKAFGQREEVEDSSSEEE